jgi:hypothetical protein
MTVQISEIQDRRLARLAKRYDENKNGQLEEGEVNHLMRRIKRVQENTDGCVHPERLIDIDACEITGLIGGSIGLTMTGESIFKTINSHKFANNLGGKIAKGGTIGGKFLLGVPLSLGAGFLLAMGAITLEHKRNDRFSDYESEIKALNR